MGSMRMPMVDIRVMRVGVPHRQMGVRMAVRLTDWIGGAMFMPVMLVVNVKVFVG